MIDLCAWVFQDLDPQRAQRKQFRQEDFLFVGTDQGARLPESLHMAYERGARHEPQLVKLLVIPQVHMPPAQMRVEEK